MNLSKDKIMEAVRLKFFHEEDVYREMEGLARQEHLQEMAHALPYMRQCHEGQYRKSSKFFEERVPYMIHPLAMVKHAYALGIRDDALLAATLLHDVVEDTDVTLEQLPFSEAVKEMVGLVTFVKPEGMTKAQAKAQHFEWMKSNEGACVLKLLDRCNNVSTMAGSFTPDKMLEYMDETEKYILPLADMLINNGSQYGNIAFALRFHIISVLETIKCVLADQAVEIKEK